MLSLLNEIVEEWVYIKYLDGFAITKDKKMDHKLHKELYELKKTLGSYYERQHSYLDNIGFNIDF